MQQEVTVCLEIYLVHREKLCGKWLFFYVVFIFIIGLICFQILGNFLEWHCNNQSPIETCQALLVTKRTDVFGNETARTNYYLTFEWNGQRREFHVKDHEYGLLTEGDKGTLTFQGTRMLSFERKS